MTATDLTALLAGLERAGVLACPECAVSTDLSASPATGIVVNLSARLCKKHRVDDGFSIVIT